MFPFQVAMGHRDAFPDYRARRLGCDGLLVGCPQGAARHKPACLAELW